METTLELGRIAVLHTKQECLREKKRIEGSEVCDSEVKEMAVARLQQQIESLELQEQELWPVEAEMRQMGVDEGRSREEQIDKLRTQTLFCSKPSKTCGVQAQFAPGTWQEWCACPSAEVEEEEDEPDARGRHAGPTAGEGANQAPSPVTPTDW